MVDQMTLQTIGILLTGLTVSIAAIYYTLTLRYTRRNQELQLETRQANLFSQYHLHYQSKDFNRDISEILYNWEWKDYEDFRTKYGSGSGNMEAFSMWMRIFQYYDGLGVLIKRGLLDKTLVADMMSELLILFWEKNEGVIKSAREYHNLPGTVENTEFLYNVIKEILDKQHPELKP
jgi:hypothetical protein